MKWMLVITFGLWAAIFTALIGQDFSWLQALTFANIGATFAALIQTAAIR